MKMQYFNLRELSLAIYQAEKPGMLWTADIRE